MAFQLRMHGDENIAHFFDWLATPAEALIKIIEADFDVFHPDHLALKTDHDPHAVEDKSTGVVFFHQFPQFRGHVQPDFLLFYDVFIRKFRYLAERFRNHVSTKPVTLVRDGITKAQALRLEKAMRERFPEADMQFLYLNGAGAPFRTPLGHSRRMREDGSSLGDPVSWAKLLADEGLISAPYRRGTFEILGFAHDDYNQDHDHRFTDAQLRTAIEANPSNVFFRVELSRLYMHTGRLEQATEIATAALADHPDHPHAQLQAARVLWESGTIDAREAADRLCPALQQIQPSTEWLRLASIALLQSQQIEQALTYANKAVALGPVEYDNYFHKAKCLIAKKNFPGAELALAAAAQFGNLSYAHHHIHSRTLAQSGRLEEAVEAERRSLQNDPDFFESLFNMACLLSELQRHDEALQTFRHALRVAGPHRQNVEAKIAALTGDLAPAPT